MNVESEYRPDAAEAQNGAEAEPIVESESTGAETQLAPEDALARFSREVGSRFGAPEAASESEEGAESNRELKSAFDIAMDRAGEASPEDVAGREARTREQEQARGERVGELAKELLDQRMAGTVSYEAVDKFLADQGVEPWTQESAQIMETWDRVQATKVYEQTLGQFERAIREAEQQIAELESQSKGTSYKGKAAKLEGAIMAHEARIKELGEKKDAFAFPKPEVAAVVAPEPEPAVEEPQPVEQPEAVAGPAEAAPVPSNPEPVPVESADAPAVENAGEGAPETEGEELVSFERGQELWYRTDSGEVRHAWVQQEAGTPGNNLVLEERAPDGHVTASYSYDPVRLEGQLLTESEVAALERQAAASEEVGAASGEGEDSEESEMKLEKDQTIELPDGKRVKIIKKRFLRDTYQVADLTAEGMITLSATWHNMSGSELRKGKEVSEEESDDESGEAPDQELPLAA